MSKRDELADEYARKVGYGCEDLAIWDQLKESFQAGWDAREAEGPTRLPDHLHEIVRQDNERLRSKVEQLDTALDKIDWHIRTMRSEGIIDMKEMCRALKVISDSLAETEEAK